MLLSTGYNTTLVLVCNNCYHYFFGGPNVVGIRTRDGPKNQVSPYPLCFHALFGSACYCTLPRSIGILLWGTRVLL